MRSHVLQLNIEKTEITWLTTGRRLHLLPQPLQVGSDLITPVLVIRDLGIHIDADVSMRSHVIKTTSACFAPLRQLRGIRRSVSRTVFQSLVSCLVLPRLDYCNAVLAGIPKSCTALPVGDERGRTARLRVTKVRSLLCQLHCLKVLWRIDYKLAVLVYKCLHGLAASCLADELHHPAESQFRRGLRSASSHELSVPRTRLSIRRQSISIRRCPDPEQSSAACHICSVTSCLLLSLEDIFFRTLLPVITAVVPAK